MHELSIAQRIRRVLEDEFADQPHLAVASVHLEVGTLSGVVPEALEFAWRHVAEGSSLLGDSRLDIDRREVGGHCATCDAERTIPGSASLRCPTCGEPLDRITAGDELDILSVEVVEPAA